MDSSGRDALCAKVEATMTCKGEVFSFMSVIMPALTHTHTHAHARLFWHKRPLTYWYLICSFCFVSYRQDCAIWHKWGWWWWIMPLSSRVLLMLFWFTGSLTSLDKTLTLLPIPHRWVLFACMYYCLFGVANATPTPPPPRPLASFCTIFFFFLFLN